METNYFKDLNEINVTDKVEKKNNLSYLSWAWAWGEVKKKYPNANYTIYERETEYGLVNYFTDGMTAWVKTGVTIGDIEHIEHLPIMDYRNKSIPLDKITSFDVNKAIQRSITKAIARHGLGLYIYAGEDLPEDYVDPVKQKQQYINEVNQRMQDLVKKHQSKEKVYGLLKLSSEQFLNLYSNEPHKLIELIDKYAK